MQTPSNPAGSSLDLTGSLEDVKETVSPGPGESLQRILRFELKEEGNHVLAVTVTYTETVLGEGRAASGRVRTFRKLYQFVAQQLLSVRTKAGYLTQQGGPSRYLLEAQLENMGEAAVCLEVRGCLITQGTPQASVIRTRAVCVVHFIYLKQRPCIVASPGCCVSTRSTRSSIMHSLYRVPVATPGFQEASTQQAPTRTMRLSRIEFR